MRAILDRALSAPAAQAAPPTKAESGSVPMVYELPVAAGRSFDVALLQEDIGQGQRVEAFTLEACAGGECREFARGTTIGYKRLLRFPEVRLDPARRDVSVKLTIGQSRGTPVIAPLGLYNMGTNLPQDAAGGVKR
jgi:alpha-L-fucosidase